MNCVLKITATPDHALLARIAQVLAWQRCRVEFLALWAPPGATEATLEVKMAGGPLPPELVRRQLLKLETDAMLRDSRAGNASSGDMPHLTRR